MQGTRGDCPLCESWKKGKHAQDSAQNPERVWTRSRQEDGPPRGVRESEAPRPPRRQSLPAGRKRFARGASGSRRGARVPWQLRASVRGSGLFYSNLRPCQLWGAKHGPPMPLR